MPTYSSAALENLVEPRVRDSLKKRFGSPIDGRVNELGKANPRHVYISPALYVTPEQTPISECSALGPVSPSPYVANRKGRGGGNGRLPAASRQASDFPSRNEGDDACVEQVVADNFVYGESFDMDAVVGGRDEGFSDSREVVVSVESEEEANGFGGKQLESRSFVSANGEFFDAIDDFSEGPSSNTPSCGSRIESELHVARHSLLEEIEKRKTAEESLALMQSQWERIHNLMSEAGLAFPAPPTTTCDSMHLGHDLIDQFCQEVFVTRFVTEAVGRGQARAEAEEAVDLVIESKDTEITRLRDRLQYYETVNHEMSQRKLVEIARIQQKRKQTRRRWLWSIMGLSIAMGASLATYSCIPHATKFLSSLKPADSTDST